MATNNLIFNSWGKGILSPMIRGRVDTNHYYSSAEEMYNMLVRTYGNAVNRAGSQYVFPSKTPYPRLKEFIYDVDDAFIIELGSKYFRFFTQEGLVVISGVGLQFWNDDLNYVAGLHIKDFAEGTVYICIKPNGPDTKDIDGNVVGDKELTDDEYWYVQEEVADNLWAVEIPHVYIATVLSEVQLAQKDDVIYFSQASEYIQKLIRYSATKWTFEEVARNGGPWEDFNTTERQVRNNNGWGVEEEVELEFQDKTIDGLTVEEENPLQFEEGLDELSQVMVGRFIRMGKPTDEEGQAYFKIISVQSEKLCMAIIKSDGDEPNNWQILWSFNSWYEGNYPNAISFHEARLLGANNLKETQKIWFSKSFNYEDFNYENSGASDGFQLGMYTERANKIYWLSSGDNLAIGTYSGEFVTRSPQDGPLRNGNKNSTRQSGWGSRRIQPIKIGNYVYYVERGGRKVREFYYLWDNNNYDSRDMTKFSEQVTLSGIREIAYQQNPDGHLYCVLANGEMAVLVRDVEHEIQAWTRLVTEGLYRSVAVIPNADGENDQVWNLVARGEDNYLIEYMNNFAVNEKTDNEQLRYLDSSLTYDAFTEEEANIWLASEGHRHSGTDKVRAYTYKEPFTQDDVGTDIRLIYAPSVWQFKGIVMTVNSITDEMDDFSNGGTDPFSLAGRIYENATVPDLLQTAPMIMDLDTRYFWGHSVANPRNLIHRVSIYSDTIDEDTTDDEHSWNIGDVLGGIIVDGVTLSGLESSSPRMDIDEQGRLYMCATRSTGEGCMVRFSRGFSTAEVLGYQLTNIAEPLSPPPYVIVPQNIYSKVKNIWVSKNPEFPYLFWEQERSDGDTELCFCNREKSEGKYNPMYANKQDTTHRPISHPQGGGCMDDEHGRFWYVEGQLTGATTEPNMYEFYILSPNGGDFGPFNRNYARLSGAYGCENMTYDKLKNRLVTFITWRDDRVTPEDRIRIYDADTKQYWAVRTWINAGNRVSIENIFKNGPVYRKGSSYLFIPAHTGEFIFEWDIGNNIIEQDYSTISDYVSAGVEFNSLIYFGHAHAIYLIGGLSAVVKMPKVWAEGEKTYDTFNWATLPQNEQEGLIEYPFGTPVDDMTELSEYNSWNRWGRSAERLGGLEHIEAMEGPFGGSQKVGIVADGSVLPQQYVVNGEITLDRKAFRITAGIPYSSWIVTNPLNMDTQTGTSKGRIERVNGLAVQLFRTNGLKAGPDMENLEVLQYFKDTDQTDKPLELFTGTTPNHAFNGDWGYDGKIVIRQDEPLPMCVLAIVPKVTFSK